MSGPELRPPAVVVEDYAIEPDAPVAIIERPTDTLGETTVRQFRKDQEHESKEHDG